MKSTKKHQQPFAESAATAKELADIRTLLECLRRLQIGQRLKKAISIHAIWQVAVVTGGTYSRFRSDSVIRKAGLPIQRDHIYKKRILVEQFLASAPDLDAIIERARCCIVTVEEHTRLHKIDPDLDGWDRYKKAKVIVYDMVDKTRVA
jgi:hypothetical protein